MFKFDSIFTRFIALSLVIGLVSFGITVVSSVGINASAQEKKKIAVVTDVGGRGDLSFNDMGFKGADEAAEEFGVELQVAQPASEADYLPNVRTLARTGDYEVIIGVGFLLTDAIETAAKQFPDQNFALIDAVVDQPNVLNFVFKEQESSALVGALAAMTAAHYDYSKVGIVLGIEIPPLWKFEAGYRFGIKWGLDYYEKVTGEKANVDLLWTYTGTFSDVAKGKSSANAQISQGAGLIYNVAGPLGLGILEAVKDNLNQRGKESGPPFMIGVDANQDYMGNGNKVLASGMKRIDRASYIAVKRAVEGNFKGGTEVLGLDDQGVGLSRYSLLVDFMQFGLKGDQIKEENIETIKENWLEMREEIPQFIWTGVNELENLIVSGNVTPPVPSTEEEMKDVRKEYP
ncbi:BMP family ABC transporter substrate-binding protein [Candidatus Bipolaricaulota bacterium]|nr:BMP family ABC transporter substrate-binding protein [Candidatus Bipolaricaulota bacterium]